MNFNPRRSYTIHRKLLIDYDLPKSVPGGQYTSKLIRRRASLINGVVDSDQLYPDPQTFMNPSPVRIKVSKITKLISNHLIHVKKI